MLNQMSDDEDLEKGPTPSDHRRKAREELEPLSYYEIEYIRKWMRCLHFEERESLMYQ